MPKKIGRWVVDGHIHCGKKDAVAAGSKTNGIWAEVDIADNSDTIIFDMDTYGVDMGLLLPSFLGTTNESHKAIVERHPDRFKTCCMDSQTRLKAAHGEQEWTLKAALKELDEVLSGDPGFYAGIGEFCPGCMGTVRKPVDAITRTEEYFAIAELAASHDVPFYFHEYQDPTGLNRMEAFHSITKVITKIPDVKITIAHGGGPTVPEIKETAVVASRGSNVELETGYWRAEYYEIILKDAQLGADRLLWGGGDTGSRLWYPQATRPGRPLLEPTTVWYNRLNWEGKKREAQYQPDFLGWPTRQVDRLIDLDIATQDEINLIVGGNAVRHYKFPKPELCTFACARPDLKIK